MDESTSVVQWRRTTFQILGKRPFNGKTYTAFMLDSLNETSMAIVQEQKQWYKEGEITKQGPNQVIHIFLPCVATADSKNPAESRHRPKRVKRWTEAQSEKSSVLERAAEPPLRYPSFVKEMLPSHVAGGFWLCLPMAFCCEHMGKSDKMILLEDEIGEKFQTKYLSAKMELSAGCKGLVFH